MIYDTFNYNSFIKLSNASYERTMILPSAYKNKIEDVSFILKHFLEYYIKYYNYILKDKINKALESVELKYSIKKLYNHIFGQNEQILFLNYLAFDQIIQKAFKLKVPPRGDF